MPVVKDVVYLDVAGADATISDPGTGAYPVVQLRDNYILHLSGPTTQVVIPWGRVKLITLTQT